MLCHLLCIYLYIYLMETKLSLISLTLVLDTLGSPFADFFWLPTDGTRGGILLGGCSDLVALSNPVIGEFHISAVVSSTPGEDPWWTTGVYDPQWEADKMSFLTELHDLRATISGPWLLGATST